jgi:3-oxoacyl-[acyl-carrier protein] reductase
MCAIERHVRNLSSVMTKFIVITGASKGIGRAAANALADDGWSVIGVARGSPDHFPGVFIEADLADRDRTKALATELAARGRVLGIVNNVALLGMRLSAPSIRMYSQRSWT